jgi:hypothetical protein
MSGDKGRLAVVASVCVSKHLIVSMHGYRS